MSWPIWEKEVSTFDWSDSEPEAFYVLEGKLRVELDEGDLVTFPKGVGCKWDVREPIRKHYRFG